MLRGLVNVVEPLFGADKITPSLSVAGGSGLSLRGQAISPTPKWVSLSNSVAYFSRPCAALICGILLFPAQLVCRARTASSYSLNYFLVLCVSDLFVIMY